VRWHCRDRSFDLEHGVLVMGVVNVTPDSFSDGGRYLDPAAAMAHAQDLLEQGADLLDLGAESTRPGADPVPAEEQWRRLEPLVAPLTRGGACVSIDTGSARVAERALGAGAHVVNDITALGDSDMGRVVAGAGAGMILMHMQGTPATMQVDPRYGDSSAEVATWLAARMGAACGLGIAEASIALDPGIGFGKRLEHNLELIARLDELGALGRPIVVGISRKSFLGRILDLDVEERLEGGLGAAAIAVFQGARVVRTHDVRSTTRAVRVAAAVRDARRGVSPREAHDPTR
jgi:dihydropteroate synthase